MGWFDDTNAVTVLLRVGLLFEIDAEHVPVGSGGGRGTTVVAVARVVGAVVVGVRVVVGVVVVGGTVVVVLDVDADVVAGGRVVVVDVVVVDTVVVKATVIAGPSVSTFVSPSPPAPAVTPPPSNATTAIGALIFAHKGHPR